jgi:hypothetical protein
LRSRGELGEGHTWVDTEWSNPHHALQPQGGCDRHPIG